MKYERNKKICNRDYTIEDMKEWEFDENGRYPDKIIQEKLWLIKSMMERMKFRKLDEHTVSYIYNEFFDQFQRHDYTDYDYFW